MATVPEELRQGVREQLDRLVSGERPELLAWVNSYGAHGARLVAQPDAIWTHERTQVTPRHDGGWHIVVPLWTAEEGPSDLSAELTVSADGAANIDGVHVL